MTLVVALILVGSALVIAEVMFPSFGLIGIMAATCFLFAILEAFDMGDTQGYGAVAAVVLAIPGAIWSGFWILRTTPLGNRLLMKPPPFKTGASPAAAEAGLDQLVGREGHTESPMRPAGIVDLDGRRVDAVSDGGFLAAGTRVRVTHVEGNRIVVTEVESSVADA
ncbi:MAG: hypothetical protein KDB18_12995 [Salinibacterium sp.]|nr:hypothetical protein [Planctomycetota bacterium]MCB1282431.1 hypothetical protein [Salinibacterium sp.]